MASYRALLLWGCVLLACLMPSTAQRRTRTGAQLCQARADICFLIDSSGSIRDNNPPDGSFDNWQLLLSFVESVVDAFDVGVDMIRFGAVKFSNSAELMFNLQTYYDKNQIMQEIRQTGYIGGFTNTFEGLRKLRTECFGGSQNGDRPNVNNIAIVITDGRPTMNQDLWQAESQAVKSDGIFTFAVGITNQIDDETLRELSSPPQQLGRTYFTSPNFVELDRVIETLVNETCLVPTAPPVLSTTPIFTIPPACPFGADVVFIMDASDSIIWNDPNNWDIMKSFVATVSQSFPIDNGQFRVAVVKFAKFANAEFFLTQYQTNRQVTNAITGLQLAQDGGGTNIGDAMRLSLEEVFRVGRGDRTDAPNVGILITDGRDSTSPTYADEQARRLRDSGVELFTIGITSDVDENQLRRIATPPAATHVYQVNDFSGLQNIISDVIRRACAVLSTTTTTTPAPTTTTTAYVPPVQDCEGSDADVVFLLDASGSIGGSNFQRIRQFVTNVINGLDVESGKIRVGIITFSNNARVEFDLNRYRTRFDLVTAVKDIRYTQGTTNMADALMAARNQLFQASAGDRPSARNMIVLITDGASDNGVQTRQQAALTKAAGVHITAVAIGAWLDLDELAAVASFPSEQNLLRVDDFNTLDRVRDGIRNYICDNTDECRNNPCVRGECKNAIGYAYCVCEPGYAGPRCDQQCRTGGDVVFVLDNSGSIGRQNFNTMMKFVRDTVSYLDIDGGNTNDRGSRVGVVSYSDQVQPQFNLNAYTDAQTLLNNLNVRYTGGKTNTAAAIRYMRETMYRPENGDRRNVDNVAVILTDGRSNDADATWKESIEARKTGIKIIVVGIGRGVDDYELMSMASDPVESNVINVDSFEALQSIQSAVSGGLCNNQNECASNPCQNGATCMDVLNGYDCSPCPPGFTGYNCERRCSGELDLAFLVDSSGSIRVERFPIIKNFVKDVVANYDVHLTTTRIGAIYWSENAKVQFTLSDYNNRQDVIQAVERIPFLGGKTFTTSALRMLRQELFTGRNGDRTNVQNYVILITDGNSNIDPAQTIPEAILARNEGAHIIVVAIGKDVNSAELRGMASYPKSANIYNVERISQLPSLKDQIITSICNDVDECSSNPCRNGGRCVDTIKAYRCVCRGDWSDINCDRRCSRRMDVTLVVDLSGSVEKQKQMILDFARRMANGFNTNQDRVRIAAVAFATDIIGRFYLNTYQSQSAIVNALTFYHRNGKTNIPAALRVTRDEIYTQARGDRNGVRNVAILISDGDATVDTASTIPQATQTKRRGIELFTVAVGNRPNMDVLREVASDPDTSHVYRLPDRSAMESTANEMLSYLCQ